MDVIAFFKLQAKNFLRDWKTRYLDEEGLWQYRSRFIDVNGFFCDFGDGAWEDEEPSLMRAQHFVALICELDSWAELINLPQDELDFLKYVWERQNQNSFADWAESMMMWDSLGMPIEDPEAKRYLYDHQLKVMEMEGTGSWSPGYLIEKPKA